MSTMQKIYDHIWNHFIVEGNPFGYDHQEYICKYRTTGGAKCAVGCLIPDDLYDEEIEGIGVADWFEIGHAWRIEKNFGSIEGTPILNLVAIQHAHDHAAENGDISEFKEELIEFARQWDLLLIVDEE